MARRLTHWSAGVAAKIGKSSRDGTVSPATPTSAPPSIDRRIPAEHFRDLSLTDREDALENGAESSGLRPHDVSVHIPDVEVPLLWRLVEIPQSSYRVRGRQVPSAAHCTSDRSCRALFTSRTDSNIQNLSRNSLCQVEHESRCFDPLWITAASTTAKGEFG